MKRNIEECLTVKINGNDVTIKFPSKIREQMQIETNKSMLSNGTYAILALSSVNSSNRMLDVIDTLSHFLVVIPDLHLKLGLKDKAINASELEVSLIEPLVKIYNNEYARFYNQFVSADLRIGSAEVQRECLEYDKVVEDIKEETVDSKD
jgi:hypothetical protein